MYNQTIHVQLSTINKSQYEVMKRTVFGDTTWVNKDDALVNQQQGWIHQWGVSQTQSRGPPWVHI